MNTLPLSNRAVLTDLTIVPTGLDVCSAETLAARGVTSTTALAIGAASLTDAQALAAPKRRVSTNHVGTRAVLTDLARRAACPWVPAHAALARIGVAAAFAILRSTQLRSRASMGLRVTTTIEC